MTSDQAHIFHPDLELAAARQTLTRLLVPGELPGPHLRLAAIRLTERFRVFATTAPCPLWAPGLFLTNEIRSTTELYLPMQEIRPALTHLCSRALLYAPFLDAAPFCSAASWPEVLERLLPLACPADPGRLISRALVDEAFRTAFLFAAFLPRRFSGGFGRYPAQLAFVRQWLRDNRRRFGNEIRCLDGACGSGEGTYDLVQLLVAEGLVAEGHCIEGCTIEPLELAAAAHGLMPHDPGRARAFREVVARLMGERGGMAIQFRQEDLLAPTGLRQAYDLVVCNGILGGPLLGTQKEVARALAALVARLRPGGLLVAADRFHGGWEKAMPLAERARMLGEFGLTVVEIGEGIGGIKS